MFTVCQHFVYFLLSSKSHKCQKHAEQELMKMADKHRYCKNLPNIFGRFRVTLDHVWPLRYITLSHPCVIYLYCFCIVWSYKHTYTAQYNILHTAITFFSLKGIQFSYLMRSTTCNIYLRCHCFLRESQIVLLRYQCVTWAPMYNM